VFPDVYLPSSVELDRVTRLLAAYLLVRDRGGVLGGYSAAALLDAGCGPYRVPVEVIMSTRACAHPGCGSPGVRWVELTGSSSRAAG
jgi:hypothetical protein